MNCVRCRSRTGEWVTLHICPQCGDVLYCPEEARCMNCGEVAHYDIKVSIWRIRNLAEGLEENIAEMRDFTDRLKRDSDRM